MDCGSALDIIHRSGRLSNLKCVCRANDLVCAARPGGSAYCNYAAAVARFTSRRFVTPHVRERTDVSASLRDKKIK